MQGTSMQSDRACAAMHTLNVSHIQCKSSALTAPLAAASLIMLYEGLIAMSAAQTWQGGV